MTTIQSIGVREFRANLSRYAKATTPVEVTSHGEAIGYYIPVQMPKKGNLDAFQQAADHLSSLLKEKGIDEDDIIKEFQSLRHQNESDE